ncbi:MAG: YfhO family protein [Lachnospirales bacterium]
MSEKKENILYTNRWVVFTFFLVFLIMGATYFMRGVFPFGDNIILKVDLYHQYGPFHEELRSRILNGQSLFYSWEGGLGKEFFTQMAYYTASPISILILLFPQNLMPEAMALFILIKTSFAGAFFAYYLRKRFNNNNVMLVVFGIFYAFSAYMTGYYWNVMWLDAVALFPVIAFGIEALVKNNKHLTYCITLAVVILINFYIAFLVCVFAALYYLVVLFSTYSWSRDRKTIISLTIKFAIISLLAGGISMFLTVPTAIALGNTATSDTSFPAFEIYENIYQLITNHFIGARSVVLARNEDLPNVYSGVLTLVILPLYFFNRKIEKKEKWLIGALLIFMLLCSCIKPLDYMIHGMHFPSNLPHRYTFIYSFIILTIAYKGFLNIKNVDVRIINYVAIAYVVIMLISEYLLVPMISDIDRVLSDVDIIINVVAIVIYVVLINIYAKSSIKDLTSFMLIFLVLAIAESSFSSYEGLDRTTKRQSYVEYIDSADEAVNYLNEKENGNFYRTEFRRFTTINDAALYHYNGFSQFSSLAPGGISEFIGNLGIAATGNSFRYYDPTSLVDAMFDIKYVMNKENNGNGEIKNERYTHLQNFGNVWVYENDRVLPLGFMVNSAIKDWKTKDSTPFQVQNDFVNNCAGVAGNMFTNIPVTNIEKTYMEVTEDINDNEFKYKLTNPENLALEPTVVSNIKIDKNQYIYAYVDAGNSKRVKYSVITANGTERIKEDRELSAGKSLFDIGNVNAGETVRIQFSLTNKGEFEKTYRKDGKVKLYLSAYDDSVFQNAYDKLSEQTYNITSFEDTKITGTIDVKNDGVMFTSIPYVEGWKVYVDGVETDKVSIGDNGVIGVELTQGQHEITFKFSPQGLVLGLIISLISILLAVIYTIFDKKKNAEKPVAVSGDINEVYIPYGNKKNKKR